MANGPHDYRDPKVTTTGRTGPMKWLWWVLGAIVLLLLLAWLLGLFGADEAVEVETDEAVVVEETEATEEAVEEEAVVTEDGEPLVTEDGDAVVTEEAAEDADE